MDENPRREWLVDHWVEALWWDLVAAAILTFIHIIVVHFFHHGDWLLWINSSQRGTVYSTAALIISALGGLSAIAVTVYMSAEGERARAVRRYHHGSLRKNWRGLLSGAGITAMLCLLAQVLDVGNDPHDARFIFEFAFILAAIRFARLLWLFDAMMKVSDQDVTEFTPRPPVELDPGWVSKSSS